MWVKRLGRFVPIKKIYWQLRHKYDYYCKEKGIDMKLTTAPLFEFDVV